MIGSLGILKQIRARLPKRLIPWRHSYGATGLVRLPGIKGSDDLNHPTAAKALQHPAVVAAVNTISRGIAVAPIKVIAKGGGEAAPEALRVEDWLNRSWSHGVTAYDAKEKIVRDILLHGIGAGVVTKSAGRPVAIHIVEPSTLTKERKPNGAITYRITAVDPAIVWDTSQVVELTWMTDSDGVGFFNPVEVGWSAISAGLLAIAFQRDFWARGASPWLIAKTEGVTNMGDERWEAAQKNLSRTMDMMVKGGRRMVLLPDRVSFTEVGMDPNAAQLTELGEQSVEQIARLYGIPLSFLADPRAGGYASLEEESRRLLRQTLAPYAMKLEKQLDKCLFPAGQHHVKVDLDAELRGDSATRWANHNIALRSGVLTPNEVRELEGYMPSDNPAADMLWRQGAMEPLEEPTDEPEPELPQLPFNAPFEPSQEETTNEEE